MTAPAGRRCYLVVGFDVTDDIADHVEFAVRRLRAELASIGNADGAAVYATYAPEHQTRLREIEAEISPPGTPGT